jgi:hypothetical protein
MQLLETSTYFSHTSMTQIVQDFAGPESLQAVGVQIPSQCASGPRATTVNSPAHYKSAPGLREGGSALTQMLASL